MNRMCILVPAYQAGKSLGDVLDHLPENLPIVVVNDGSTDDTGAVAAARNVMVLTHPVNRGKGAALQTGFDYAISQGFQMVLTMDADGQHDPDDIAKLIEVQAQTEADLVIGTRLSDPTNIPPVRYWTNRFGSWLISKLARIPLADTQSGFRIYRTELLRNLQLRTTGFATETELILKFSDCGARVRQVPVRTIYHPPERTLSHFRPIKDTYRICVMVLRHILKLH